MIAEEFQAVFEEGGDIAGAEIDVVVVVLIARPNKQSGDGLFAAFDFSFPRRDAAEFVFSERLVIFVLEPDADGFFFQADFCRIDFIFMGDVFDAHAEGEVDDGDGGAWVHAVGPWGGGLPAVGFQSEACAGAVGGNSDEFDPIWGKRVVDLLADRGGGGTENRVEVSIAPL